MKKEIRVRLGKNGEVWIPAAFRKGMGIRGADEVLSRIENGELFISSVTHRRIALAQRLVRRYVKPGTSLVDEFIAERRGGSPHQNIRIKNIKDHAKKE
jgi:bifunctional DNA-binding transcriptional regulator/antitoxin component of YhaV-PrlF toxin-antitoxin module